MAELHPDQFTRLAQRAALETGTRREMVLTTIDIWLDAWNARENDEAPPDT